MYGIHDLALFIVSGLLLNMAPGPDTLLIVTRSATHGWRAGSAAALGIGAGCLVHVSAAALGLSALLAASGAAFRVVTIAGAAYLVYLGVGLLRSTPAPVTPQEAAAPAGGPVRYRRIFLQGLWTNLLNPKVALFFLAFVPQFISPDAPQKPIAFLVLGILFDVNSMVWCHLVAWLAAAASRRLERFRPAARWINRLIGGVFIALGLRLALARPA